MSRDRPDTETETTHETQANAIDASAASGTPPQALSPMPTSVFSSVIDTVKNVGVYPGQAYKIYISSESFTNKNQRVDPAPGHVDSASRMPVLEAQLQYMASNPPEYGLVTNFPPGTCDSACFLWSGLRESLLDLGQESLGDYKKERNYRIEDVGSMGKGMVAARDFGVGDVIMLERPAVVKPLLIQGGFGGAEVEALLEKLLARLPEDVRNEYMTLSNCHPEETVRTGILRTNCIGITFPGNDTIIYQAVSVDLSRCNHRCVRLSAITGSSRLLELIYGSTSCSANATYEFSHKRFAFELRALCPIKAGEQVFTSYISFPVLCERAASRARELQIWNFTCICPFCTLPPGEQRQSDKRRAELLTFQTPNEGPLS